ncbi:MAG: SDR family oxidoreductase [Verrucomicrobiota bacterium]
MGCVFLITASTGIGAETARQLAEGGHSIFIVSRTEANVAALVDELGSAADGLAGDLSDPEFAPRAVAACVERFGRVDGLFNVAGISARKFGDGPLHECSEDGWAKSFEVNVATQYRMSREVIKVMLGQKLGSNGQRGVILNMTSILGVHPEPTNFSAIAYAAGKGAIISMTRSAAAYYAKDGIRVNAVAPALVHTPMSARASEDPAIVGFVEEKQPLTKGMIPVSDAASACVFLLGNMARSVTGEVLEVDAGWNLV